LAITLKPYSFVMRPVHSMAKSLNSSMSISSLAPAAAEMVPQAYARKMLRSSLNLGCSRSTFNGSSFFVAVFYGFSRHLSHQSL